MSGLRDTRSNLTTSINDLAPEFQANNVLYRLAVALGYPQTPRDGETLDTGEPNREIVCDMEEVVSRAVSIIRERVAA